MDYAKGILSGLTAIILAELVPGSWSIFRGISGTRATGLGALEYGLLEALFSPLFWIVAVLFFALLFLLSHLPSKPLRILLFWIPTLTVSSIFVTIVALIAYVLIRLRHP